jgi:hypothetical protein
MSMTTVSDGARKACRPGRQSLENVPLATARYVTLLTKKRLREQKIMVKVAYFTFYKVQIF